MKPQNWFKKKKNKDLYDFGRRVYADQIFKAIDENRKVKSDSSFIFGVSGHWGEGKTHLLKLLEQNLMGAGYTVVWFSPWKYSEDKQSLMRKFINLLNKKLWFFLRINLEDFEKDKTSFKPSKKFLVLYTLLILFVVAVYIHVVRQYQIILPNISGILQVIALPALIVLAGQLLSLQNSKKAIATVDGFDEKLDSVLKRYWLCRKKLVVFVDDLDRVNETEAKNVLSTLRTFFDKPQITYVVTGDNKILENSIGKNFSDNPEFHAEEGRRFLKKIFNVYWRMPLPAKWQIEAFIKNKLLNSPFSEEEEIIFSDWLIKYFELNPRNIERFIDTVKFNINSVEQDALLIPETETEKKEQIKEVLDHKLLLVRALIIQEKAYPLFEKIVRFPSFITSLEREIENGQTDLSPFFGDIKLTPTQLSFLASFLTELPRFYQDGGTTVRIDPFFKLVAEIGTDERGISVENFEKFLKNDDVTKIAQWLNLSNKNLDELIAVTERTVNDVNIALAKRSLTVATILRALDEGRNSSITAKFLQSLGTSINTILKTDGVLEGKENYQIVFKLLGQISEEVAITVCKELKFVSAVDFTFVIEPLGRNATICVLNWVNEYMTQNLWDAIIQLEKISPFIEKERMGRYFTDRIEPVLSSYVAAPTDIQEHALNFLQQIPGGLKQLRVRIHPVFDTFTPEQQTSIETVIIKKFGKQTWGQKRVKKWLINGN